VNEGSLWGKSKSPAKPKAAKSNIRIGSLMGKIKVAPDAWDDDLRADDTDYFVNQVGIDIFRTNNSPPSS
jgi:hypothetical protein